MKVAHVWDSVNAVISADPVRRQPEQARSRKRVDTILQAATELIGEVGTEPPTMTDIAQRAGMGVTALYRYFPNKQAVLRELSLRVFEHDRDTLVAGELPADASFEQVVRDAVVAYWHLHRDEPYRLRLRAAILADSELSDLDLADSRRNAALMAQRAAEFTGATNTAALERKLFLIVSLLDSANHAAALLDHEEAELLIEDFAAMVVMMITETLSA